MLVVSVNVGVRTRLRVGGRLSETGIDKRPAGCVRISTLGVEGDVVADTKHHGGPDQALYVYAADDYAWWEAELQSPLGPGAFGENVLLSTFDGDVHPGDRFRLGDAVVVEATAPRIPCGTFAAHMQAPGWTKRFAAAERPGFYARVVVPGTVAADDPASRLATHPEHPTLIDMMRLYYDRDATEADLRRHLELPIPERGRRDLERRLAGHLATFDTE